MYIYSERQVDIIRKTARNFAYEQAALKVERVMDVLHIPDEELTKSGLRDKRLTIHLMKSIRDLRDFT